MKILKLTERQRIELEVYCGMKGGIVAVMKKWIVISNKMAIPQDRREFLGLVELLDGSLSWSDRKTPDDVVLSEVELENAEAEALQQALETQDWQRGAKLIMRWLGPIIDQLKSA